MTNLVEIHDLTYKRNLHTILTNVNLSLHKGQIIGLLGENGAGKTTLMRLIAGAAIPHQGQIQIDGAKQVTDRKALVSFSNALAGINDNTELSKIAHFCQTVYPDFNTENFTKLLQLMNLQPEQRLNALSKGNRMKFMIAITFARQASLYLLDEPFNGIDSMARKKIVHSIIQWKPENASIIVSDHHVTDIAAILDQVVVVKDKTVVDHQSAEDIRAKQGRSIEDYYESFYQDADQGGTLDD